MTIGRRQLQPPKLVKSWINKDKLKLGPGSAANLNVIQRVWSDDFIERPVSKGVTETIVRAGIGVDCASKEKRHEMDSRS